MDVVIVIGLLVLALMLFVIFRRSRGLEEDEVPEETAPILGGPSSESEKEPADSSGTEDIDPESVRRGDDG